MATAPDRFIALLRKVVDGAGCAPGRAGMLPSGPGGVNGFSSPSVAAVHHISALAEAVGEHRFDLLRLRVRHRIQVRVEPRDEALAEATDDAGGFRPLFVVLKTLLRREAGHADVVS